jgi:hypothetical protein
MKAGYQALQHPSQPVPQTLPRIIPSSGMARKTVPLTQRDALEEAIRAFVSMLEPRRDARTPASEVYRTYQQLGDIRGWPPVTQAKFERVIMPALKSAGAQRVKANFIIYVRICVPPTLCVRPPHNLQVGRPPTPEQRPLI